MGSPGGGPYHPLSGHRLHQLADGSHASNGRRDGDSLGEGRMYVDDEGVEWEREVTHIGAVLKLACPEGKYVSHLFRTASGNIRYLLPGSGNRQLPWPPDPTSTEYGERCRCEVCNGRMVGAKGRRPPTSRE